MHKSTILIFHQVHFLHYHHSYKTFSDWNTRILIKDSKTNNNDLRSLQLEACAPQAICLHSNHLDLRSQQRILYCWQHLLQQSDIHLETNCCYMSGYIYRTMYIFCTCLNLLNNVVPGAFTNGFLIFVSNPQSYVLHIFTILSSDYIQAMSPNNNKEMKKTYLRRKVFSCRIPTDAFDETFVFIDFLDLLYFHRWLIHIFWYTDRCILSYQMFFRPRQWHVHLHHRMLNTCYLLTKPNPVRLLNRKRS